MAEQDFKMPTPPTGTPPGIEQEGIIGAYAKGRHGAPVSGLTTQEHHAVVNLHLGSLRDLEVQISKLQQEAVSSYTQIEVAQLNARAKLIAAMGQHVMAQGALKGNLLDALEKQGQPQREMNAKRALFAVDEAILAKTVESYAAVGTRAQMHKIREAHNTMPGSTAAEIYGKDDILGLALKQGNNQASRALQGLDSSTQIGNMLDMEDNVERKVFNAIMDAQRNLQATPGRKPRVFTPAEAQEAAKIITDDLVRSQFSGEVSDEAKHLRARQAELSDDWLNEERETMREIASSLGLPSGVVKDYMAHLDRMSAVTKGGFPGYATTIGDVPLSTTMEMQRDMHLAAIASLNPEDDYQAGIIKLSSQPGFFDWMVAMGFNSLEQASLFAGAHQSEYAAGLRLARDPSIRTPDDYRRKLGENAVKQGFSLRAQKIVPLIERRDVRLGRPAVEGAEGVEDLDTPDKKEPLRKRIGTAIRKFYGLEKEDEGSRRREGLDDLDSEAFGEGKEPSYTYDEETGGVTVIERATKPGDPDYEYSINALGEVHYRTLPDGAWKQSPPGSTGYKAIVQFVVEELEQTGVEIPAVASEGTEAPAPKQAGEAVMEAAPPLASDVEVDERVPDFLRETDPVSPEDAAHLKAYDDFSKGLITKEELQQARAQHRKAKTPKIPASPESQAVQDIDADLDSATTAFGQGKINLHEFEAEREKHKQLIEQQKKLEASQAVAEKEAAAAKQAAMEAGLPTSLPEVGRGVERFGTKELKTLQQTLESVYPSLVTAGGKAARAAGLYGSPDPESK